ncbi:heterokaryon incompatibility protein-domain-containing protein [Podospora aff. communis PSN243]|uniref:Heterokaryon incompatibility protein-domain-containing protein n=1 Tax=Podospora aff. communis PSN243 TaxID=3040156 RepID=A0AAV9GN75_9PEZI|nr:heterokaryon incompatibility protein-domain-containing protein [Podospora aff. communis PSN243]
MATPGIQYTPLDTTRRSIRTLQLLPGRWLDPINCIIDSVALDDKPSFDALSYVWGNASDTIPIQVNSSPFHTTKNLVAALRRLRSSVDTKTLWVDAICINQADNQEKMEQVKMMADIYKAATSVRIFLGESGVLDHASQAEQETWDDAPRFEWQRDYVLLVQSDAPRSKAGVDERGFFMGWPGSLLSFKPGSPGYEPTDPQEVPMWAQIMPPEGLNEEDEERVEAFFERQRQDHSQEATASSPLETLRNDQAGAFAIMKMLSNGRCLKSCLHTTLDSRHWVGALKVINHIASLPWWTRVWVLQEGILNQGDVFAIYGEIVAPIGLIEDSGAILPRHHERGLCCKSFFSSLPPQQQDILRRFSSKMGPLEQMRESLSMVKQDQVDRLLYLLESTCFKEATDPRDKIYGLLGLLHDSPNPIDLLPDYNISVPALYTSVAAMFIAHNKNVLLNDEIKPLDSPIPSWAPNWGPTYTPLRPVDLAKRLYRYNSWPPTLGPRPAPAPEVHPSALRILTKPISRITATTPPITKPGPNNTTSPTALLGTLLTTLESFLSTTPLDVPHDALDPRYPPTPSMPLEAAIARTLTGDLMTSLDHSMKEGTVVFDRLWRGDVAMFRTAHTAMLHPDIVLVTREGRVMSREAVEHMVGVAAENFWFACEGRVLFRAEGGYIGIAPAGAEVGDEVVLMFGSPVPFVLREVRVPVGAAAVVRGEEDGASRVWRRVVGHAYVQGVMDGEAAPGRERREGGNMVLIVAQLERHGSMLNLSRPPRRLEGLDS